MKKAATQDCLCMVMSLADTLDDAPPEHFEVEINCRVTASTPIFVSAAAIHLSCFQAPSQGAVQLTFLLLLLLLTQHSLRIAMRYIEQKGYFQLI